MLVRGTNFNGRVRRILSMFVLLVACCCGDPANSIAQNTLHVKQPLTTKLRGGDADSFTITLTEGEFVDILVEQRGSVLSATLFDPESHEVMEMDFPGGGFGPIFLSIIAVRAGAYKLNIRSVNSWANPYDYSVTI